MIQVFSQLLSAALGSVGFGLIFNLNRRYLPAAGVGGLLAWLAYLLAANTLHSVFLANLLAGFCAALYAEILARCCNAPSTPFFITAAIPLIPGSTPGIPAYQSIQMPNRNIMSQQAWYSIMLTRSSPRSSSSRA